MRNYCNTDSESACLTYSRRHFYSTLSKIRFLWYAVLSYVMSNFHNSCFNLLAICGNMFFQCFINKKRLFDAQYCNILNELYSIPHSHSFVPVTLSMLLTLTELCSLEICEKSFLGCWQNARGMSGQDRAALCQWGTRGEYQICAPLTCSAWFLEVVDGIWFYFNLL